MRLHIQHGGVTGNCFCGLCLSGRERISIVLLSFGGASWMPSGSVRGGVNARHSGRERHWAGEKLVLTELEGPGTTPPNPPLRKGGKRAQRNRDESATCARPTFHRPSRRLGTPADEAGSAVLRQRPASRLANLFKIDVRDHALGLVTQQHGGRVTEHPPGGSLLKQHPGRDSLAMNRRSCGWSADFMLEVPTGAPI